MDGIHTMELRALSRLVPAPEKFMANRPIRPEVWSIPDDSVPGLFGLAELDRILTSGLPSDRHLRVFDRGEQVPRERYVWGGRAPSGMLRGELRSHAVNGLVRSGATLALNELEYLSEPIGDLCRRLALETGQNVNAGAFLTPAGSVGLSAHPDVEAVLLIQTHGSKVWRMWEPAWRDPLGHERDRKLLAEETERVEQGAPDLEVTLRTGDVLWIPRGWLHGAVTTGEPSLHVTLGFISYTRYWLANEIVRGLDARLAGADGFRADLPWGVAGDPEGLGAEVGETVEELIAALGRLDHTDVSARVRRSMRTRYLPPRRSQPISTAVGPGVGLETRVVMVTEAVSGADRLADGRLRLNLRDTALTVPSGAADWVETRWARDAADTWSARDLVPPLDEAAAVALVSAMLREGVVRAI
ncbi:JmjC domain-containing protein [Streptomyces fagopyri]|uniref:JmjC domain-containing protein n=1 Tax=Streptomyces fagopyri TaxID=2662397 RepID=UPI00371F3714